MLLDLLFPNRCIGCETLILGQEIICEVCEYQINYYQNQTGNPESNLAKYQLLFPFENGYALMIFSKKESLSRTIIHHLKYKKREIIGSWLANKVLERISLLKPLPTLIITIPLHLSKERKRGYNQLHLFAEKIGEKLDIPVNHQVLKRLKSDRAQAKKSRSQRLISTEKFTLNQPIENTHILLIDDVLTTGKTMQDAAWQLLKSKNNTISFLVMALDV